MPDKRDRNDGLPLSSWQPGHGVSLSPTDSDLEFEILVEDIPPFVQAAEPFSLDAFQYSFLELRAQSNVTDYWLLSWEDADGQWWRSRPFLVYASEAPQTVRMCLRDEAHWQGRLAALRLYTGRQAPAKHFIRSFTLFTDNEMEPEEKLRYIGDFVLTPKRRVSMPGDAIEGRTVVPNRLLRVLGENRVHFQLTDRGGRLIGEKLIAGRLPLDDRGLSDFFSGPISGLSATGDYRLSVQIMGKNASRTLEDKVALSVVEGEERICFSEPYHFIKEFCLFPVRDTVHIFYTTGPSDRSQDWRMSPRAAKEIGHASTRDFKNWYIHEPALGTSRMGWDCFSVSSPCVIELEDHYYLFYTGVDENLTERIGLAISDDLSQWRPSEYNPIHAPNMVWSTWHPDEPSLARDPMIIAYGNVYVMYYAAERRLPAGTGDRFGIAAAVSTDLIHWADAGIVIPSQTPTYGQSAFRQANVIYLYPGYGDDLYVSIDPLRGFQARKIEMPSGWRGWRYYEDDNRSMMFAYRNLTQGNFVQACPVTWDRWGAPPLPKLDFDRLLVVE